MILNSFNANFDWTRKSRKAGNVTETVLKGCTRVFQNIAPNLLTNWPNWL
jgi:hypothetical protein